MSVNFNELMACAHSLQHPRLVWCNRAPAWSRPAWHHESDQRNATSRICLLITPGLGADGCLGT